MRPDFGDIDYNVSVVNVKAPSKELAIYPNPATDIVNFDGTGLPEGQLSIYSIDGSLLSTEYTFAEQRSINVSSLSPGMYILQSVSDMGLAKSAKLIIQRP